MDEKKNELFYQPKNGYDLIGAAERTASRSVRAASR